MLQSLYAVEQSLYLFHIVLILCKVLFLRIASSKQVFHFSIAVFNLLQQIHFLHPVLITGPEIGIIVCNTTCGYTLQISNGETAFFFYPLANTLCIVPLGFLLFLRHQGLIVFFYLLGNEVPISENPLRKVGKLKVVLDVNVFKVVILQTLEHSLQGYHQLIMKFVILFFDGFKHL